MSEPVAEQLHIFGVAGIGEVTAGSDIPSLIAASGVELMDADVVVVTSKIVSKAEGQLVAMDREAAIDAESVRLVAQRGATRIVQTRHGFVLAAAGVDASNVPAGTVALLPADPDASALRIKAGLSDRLGVDVAVVITDTMGRPWRNGLTDVCIGAAGIAVLSDLRGNVDSAGHRLDVTVTAVADELAAAAELVKGKLGGVPVAVVRGWPMSADPDDAGARPLIRPADEDMFRLGSREARMSAVTEPRYAASLSTDPVDLALTGKAIETAASATAMSDGWLLIVDEEQPIVIACVELNTKGVSALIGLGAAIERIGILLAAHGLATVWTDADSVLNPPRLDGWGVVGQLTIGVPDGGFVAWPDQD